MSTLRRKISSKSSGHTISTWEGGCCPVTPSGHAILISRGCCPPISSDHAVSADGCLVSTFTSNMREVATVSCQLRPAFRVLLEIASCELQCFYKNDLEGSEVTHSILHHFLAFTQNTHIRGFKLVILQLVDILNF